MHFCLVTYGTRGDVQPFIYLSLGLKAKGHLVTLAAPENFNQFVKSYGIDFYPLFGDAEELVASPECRKVISTGGTFAFARMALKKMRERQLNILDDVCNACKTADAIIAFNPFVFYAAAVAEKLNKKWLLIQLNPPMLPTRAFPMPMFGFPNISWLNMHTYAFINNILWQVQKKDNALFRQRLGLPASKSYLFREVINAKIPMIHAFSAELIEKPADWDEHFIVAGFFSQPKRVVIDNQPAELEQWLQVGEKPLFIGFGSIPFPDPAKLSGIIKELLSTSPTRIIYCRGWSELPDMPVSDRLFVVEQADYSWLLPKCSAAVIHGGIGTVAAVLQAGIPLIVASIFVDQPVWGKIIADKKLGIHIPWKKLSAVRILKALNTLAQSPIPETITAVSARLMHEDGVATAIQAIERYFS